MKKSNKLWADSIREDILRESISYYCSYALRPRIIEPVSPGRIVQYEPFVNIFSENLGTARRKSLEAELSEIESFARHYGYVHKILNFDRLLKYCYAVEGIEAIQELEALKANPERRKRLETAISEKLPEPEELEKANFNVVALEVAQLFIGETGIGRTLGDYTVNDLLKIKRTDKRHFGRALNTIIDMEFRKPLYLCYRNKIDFDEAEKEVSHKLVDYLNIIHCGGNYHSGEKVPENCQSLPSAHVLSHFEADYFHHNGEYGLKCLQYLAGQNPERTINKVKELAAKMELNLALAKTYGPQKGCGDQGPLFPMTKPERIAWIRNKAEQTGLDYTHLVEEISSL